MCFKSLSGVCKFFSGHLFHCRPWLYMYNLGITVSFDSNFTLSLFTYFFRLLNSVIMLDDNCCNFLFI